MEITVALNGLCYDQVIHMALFRRRHENLADRLERTGSELSQTAAEKGADTSRKVADILRRASHDIRSLDTDTVREKVMDMVDSAHDTVDRSTEVAKANIREHPFASIAVAAGMGFLVGAAISVAGSRALRRARY